MKPHKPVNVKTISRWFKVVYIKVDGLKLYVLKLMV